MWKTVELADVCDLITCGVAKRPDYVETGIPFLSAKNVKKQKVIWDDYKHITPEAHRALTKHNKPEIGDVLYTRVGSFGEAAIVDKDVEFSIFVSLTLIKPKPILLNKFLIYYLNSPMGKSLAKKGVSSSGVVNLNVGVVRKFPIPLPPLAEQQRIVAKLDAAFAEIDRAIKDVEKQAIEVTICGYKAIRNILDELGNEFSKKSLNEVVTIQPKKILALEQIGETDEVSFMGMNKLGIEKKYSEPSEAKLLKEVFKSYQYFEDNDVVFAKITPCFENGKLGIMRNLTNGIGFGSSEFVVLRSKSETRSDFVYYCLLDDVFRKNGAENMSGAVGHKRVTKEYYFNYKIPVPPLDIQDLFVKKFDEIWTHASTIAKVKHKKKAELMALKSSTLAQELQSEAA
jgi:type I restriction enzyme, S subunit